MLFFVCRSAAPSFERMPLQPRNSTVEGRLHRFDVCAESIKTSGLVFLTYCLCGCLCDVCHASALTCALKCADSNMCADVMRQHENVYT